MQSTCEEGGIVYEIKGNPSVKDALEAIGVPHPEITLIVVDGSPCGLDRQIHDGESFDVYPHNNLPLHYVAAAFPLTQAALPALSSTFISAGSHDIFVWRVSTHFTRSRTWETSGSPWSQGKRSASS